MKTPLQRRKCIVLVLGSTMYALFAALGWQAQHHETIRLGKAFATAAAVFVPVCLALIFLLRSAEKRAAAACETGVFPSLKAFVILLLCYIPMFLITFPGSFAYDVPFQLQQVFTGAYSSHHPLLHTLLLGGCVKLGHLAGNINMGAALYTLIQMTGLAACFAGTCASICRQSGMRAAKLGTLFFAVYPLHMMMAVNATKDVLFSGLFVLTLALVRETFVSGKMDRRLGAGIMLGSAGMMLLRNNALYAVAVWIVLLMAVYRRRVLRLAGMVLLGVVLCIGTNNAIKTATDAAEGDLCEMLSWPIQQMARARNLHGKLLDEGEQSAIDELMPQESWRLYDPTISDPVKFEFDTDRFLSDPVKYIQIYLSIGKKCPQAYFDALFKHTYSFWYPYSKYGVSGYYLQMGISDQYYEWCDFERIHSQSLMPRVLASLSWRFGAQGAMQIPVIGILFNMGVIVWVMLYFVIREAYLGRWKSFVVSLLPVLLWGTFLLGPVMAGRYIYPFVCCLPVLASRVREE